MGCRGILQENRDLGDGDNTRKAFPLEEKRLFRILIMHIYSVAARKTSIFSHRHTSSHVLLEKKELFQAPGKRSKGSEDTHRLR